MSEKVIMQIIIFKRVDDRVTGDEKEVFRDLKINLLVW